MTAKTKEQILKSHQAKYNKLFTALSVLPDEVPLDFAQVYAYSVDVHTPAMSVPEYNKICEKLVDWELHSYNYTGKVHGCERKKRLSVCHRILVGDDPFEDEGFYLELYFVIETAAYKKFLDFISDGKCKIETKWIVPKNEPYETVNLSCGG